jgi:peptidylprolyl isomerase domain and WD repeat-containing protein 1
MTYLFFPLCRDKSGDRDVFNERPTRDEQSVAAASTGQARSGPSPLANSATIHTMLGDIHMRLFPQQAPKAVENFVGLACSGYLEVSSSVVSFQSL